MAFDYTNYYELEYLQGDGNAYIDTGYNIRSRLDEIEAKMMDGTANTHGFFGAQNGTYFYWFYKDGPNNRYGITRNQASATYSSTGLFGSNPFVLKLCQYSTESSMTDGTNTRTFSYNRLNSYTVTNRPIWLFTMNNNNARRYTSNCRIYYFIIREYGGGTESRHFIPAERKSDNVLGLYDTVNSVFYTNAYGSGSFVAGPRISTNSIHVKVNGTWVSGTPYVNINGTWTEGKAYVKDNGTWKEGK